MRAEFGPQAKTVRTCRFERVATQARWVAHPAGWRPRTCWMDEPELEDELPPVVLTCTNCGSTRTHREALPGSERGAEMPRRYAVAKVVCSNCGSDAITSNS